MAMRRLPSWLIAWWVNANGLLGAPLQFAKQVKRSARQRVFDPHPGEKTVLSTLLAGSRARRRADGAQFGYVSRGND
jgi:hypothetical protein